VQRLSSAAALAVVATLGVLVQPVSAAMLRTVPLRLGSAGADAWRTTAAVAVGSSVSVVGVRWRGPRTAAIELRGGGSQRFGPVSVGSSVGRTWISEPIWIGRATRVEVRARGQVTGLELVLVAPGAAHASLGPRTPRSPAAGPGVPQPLIRPRAAWGADESLVRAPPFYFDRLGVAFVHHTDSTNGYARGDVPALIRGFYDYHRK